jgi:hypothetical protein
MQAAPAGKYTCGIISARGILSLSISSDLVRRHGVGTPFHQKRKDIGMRFIAVIKGPENGVQPTPGLIDAMNQFFEEKTKAGVFVEGNGLRPTSEGARVKIKGRDVRVIDGPFTETKEVIGGYLVIEVASNDEAIAFAKQFMDLHVEHLPGWDGECEVRQFNAS